VINVELKNDEKNELVLILKDKNGNTITVSLNEVYDLIDESIENVETIECLMPQKNDLIH